MMLNDGFSSKPSSWWHPRVIEASLYSATNRSIGRWSWYDHEIQSTSMNPNTYLLTPNRPSCIFAGNMLSCCVKIQRFRSSQCGEALWSLWRWGAEVYDQIWPSVLTCIFPPSIGWSCWCRFQEHWNRWAIFSEISCWCCFFNFILWAIFSDFEDGNGKFSENFLGEKSIPNPVGHCRRIFASSWSFWKERRWKKSAELMVISTQKNYPRKTLEILQMNSSKYRIHKRLCLKMGYTPNYSYLVGIMIINHWV